MSEQNIYMISAMCKKYLLKERFTPDEIYGRILKKPKEIFSTNVTFYVIMKNIMEDWLRMQIISLEEIIPDLHEIMPIPKSDGRFELQDVEEDTTKSYPIEKIMNIYFRGLPKSIFTIAEYLDITVNVGFVLEYFRELLTEWECYNFEVFREELTKNPKKALQKYLTAIHIFAYNLPVIILISTKKIDK